MKSFIKTNIELNQAKESLMFSITVTIGWTIEAARGKFFVTF